MMTLSDTRDSVMTALRDAGVRAVEYTSAAATPPCAAVVPGQPYLSWGERSDPAAFFEPMRVRLDVLLLSPQTGDAKADAKHADDLIQQAVRALLAAKIEPVRVSRPGQLTIENVGTVLAAVAALRFDQPEPDTEEE